MIKNHGLYFFYISYLEYKRDIGKISDGAFRLLKISESSFNDFIYNYEHSPKFNTIVNEIHRKEIRDEKISDILNETNRRNYSQ